MPQQVLVIDIGGSFVKMFAAGAAEPRRFRSGKHLTPESLVARVRDATHDWAFDMISVGYPGATGPTGATQEPGNLGTGWVDFDFAAAFGCPVRLVNDAAMQALGTYQGGRMLFLGLGTGLGSTLIAEHVVIPLELGCLRWDRSSSLADRLGKAGLQRGKEAWLKVVHDSVVMLRQAFSADDVVLGGGNARQVSPLPAGVRQGHNDDAFTGGFRLWEERIEPHDRPPAMTWRIVG